MRSFLNKRSFSICVVFAISTSAGGASLVRGAEPNDRYLAPVQKACDALLNEAVDDLGPQKSAMIMSVLDMKTGKPLAKLPKPPTGVRNGDRCAPFGSNANIQQDLYRVLDELSRITSD